MWTKATPEAMGVKSSGILAFHHALQEQNLHLHRYQFLRHGQEIAKTYYEPYGYEYKHMLYSLSKSFTSLAIGFAEQEHLLKLTDKVISFFPEYLSCEPCENMQAMTVKHLLTMNTGHEREPFSFVDVSIPWEQAFIQSYVPEKPGTHFLYNTCATYMLSAIVQRVSGVTTTEFLRNRLFKPLGMSPDLWWENYTGCDVGGFGLNVRMDDLAKLGQFLLQKGKWEGRQLISEQWIIDSQTPWSDNRSNPSTSEDWHSGYGYQFWCCTAEHAYRADGAFGQWVLVMPDQDMVFAANAGVEDMGAVLDLIWKYILPDVQDEPLQEDETTRELEEVLKDNRVMTKLDEEGLPTEAPVIFSAWEGVYEMQQNSYLLDSLEMRASDHKVTMTVAGHPVEVPLDDTAWVKVQFPGGEQGNTNFWSHYTMAFFEQAAARAYIHDGKLYLYFCYLETPFEDQMVFHFTEHGVKVICDRNVSFGPTHSELLGVRK